MDAVGVVHAAGRGERVPAAAAAVGADVRQLPDAVCARGDGPLLHQQRGRVGSDHAGGAAGEHDGGLCVREAALPRPRPHVPGAAGGAGDPGPGGDAAAVPDDEGAGAGEHVRGGDHPGAGDGVRDLPGAPVRAVDPGRAAGGGADRRGGRAADLLPDRAADAEAGAGDAGDLHLHGGVERFHVAADRADGPGQLHAAGGDRGAVAGARAGRGDDDGGGRGDGDSGAAAVPDAAAVLHPGCVAWECERVIGVRCFLRGRAGGVPPVGTRRESVHGGLSATSMSPTVPTGGTPPAPDASRSLDSPRAPVTEAGANKDAVSRDLPPGGVASSNTGMYCARVRQGEHGRLARHCRASVRTPGALRRAGPRSGLAARKAIPPGGRARRPSEARTKVLRFAGFLGIAFAISGCAGETGSQAGVLDDFEDPARWSVATSNQVSGEIRQVDGPEGRALCLDYDFNGVSGHAAIKRDIELEYPENYEFRFRLRGDSPRNDLEFKLIDHSGDNVWWVKRPAYEFPSQWSEVRFRKRHVEKAWGPDPDPELRASAQVEFTVYKNLAGGERGTVCFDELVLEPLPPEPVGEDDGAPLVPATVVSASGDGDPSAAVDGDPETAWRVEGGGHRLLLDLGREREFGGLRLQWAEGGHASAYEVAVSDDGHDWHTVRAVVDGGGGVDWLALPETRTRWVSIAPQAGPGAGFALAEARLLPLEFSAHPNEVIKAMAGEHPRGWFPRGFSGEQPYWTVLGVDGGEQQGLIGEDGALEVSRGGFSIEPFVLVDGALVTWADVEVAQSLQDGYLPVPGVDWGHDAFDLRVTAFAHGDREAARLVSRYVLRNSEIGR